MLNSYERYLLDNFYNGKIIDKDIQKKIVESYIPGVVKDCKNIKQFLYKYFNPDFKGLESEEYRQALAEEIFLQKGELVLHSYFSITGQTFIYRQ